MVLMEASTRTATARSSTTTAEFFLQTEHQLQGIDRVEAQAGRVEEWRVVGDLVYRLCQLEPRGKQVSDPLNDVIHH